MCLSQCSFKDVQYMNEVFCPWAAKSDGNGVFGAGFDEFLDLNSKRFRNCRFIVAPITCDDLFFIPIGRAWDDLFTESVQGERLIGKRLQRGVEPVSTRQVEVSLTRA